MTVDNSAPPPPSAVAAYSFDEGSGTTLPTRPAGSHGHDPRGDLDDRRQERRRALPFDGVNDWVTIADAADLDLTTA